MTHFDVFNGDADGICALVQLRLNEPKVSKLITGVKRDTALLNQLSLQPGDTLTVLDISVDKNIHELEQALENKISVFYVDHHLAKKIPDSLGLESIINTDANVCTSMLVNQYLDNKYIQWAIVGAFGDNLKNSARKLCKQTNLTDAEVEQLENLGIYINYNGYGASLKDLHFTPTDLYQRLVPYESPLLFIQNAKQDYEKLAKGYHKDMARAEAISSIFSNDKVAVFVLPNATWARRVSGVYGNNLANQNPDRAYAVLTLKDNADYLVSVRAPLNNKTGAAEFCQQFPTGGGRAAAAGINNLSSSKLELFTEKFKQFC